MLEAHLKINYTLFFQSVKTSSSHRMIDILDYESKKVFFQTDAKEEGARLIGSARKRSLLPKGISALK